MDPLAIIDDNKDAKEPSSWDVVSAVLNDVLLVVTLEAEGKRKRLLAAEEASRRAAEDANRAAEIARLAQWHSQSFINPRPCINPKGYYKSRTGKPKVAKKTEEEIMREKRKEAAARKAQRWRDSVQGYRLMRSLMEAKGIKMEEAGGDTKPG